MRIALISYEYAGAGSGGGIGTYVRQAAAMLARRGHDVEVFTGSPEPVGADDAVGYRVHAVEVAREKFASAVVPLFAARHQELPFDVMEGPEYGADAAGIAKKFPELPLVVRLHAPAFTIGASNMRYIGWRHRLRYRLGALRRGRWGENPWRYQPEDDPERQHALQAHEIAANSVATAGRVIETWHLDPDRVSVVPLPFVPSPELLALSPKSESRKILFLGKIEVRKGVLELARAIPSVCARYPDAHFRFLGRILPHPGDRKPLDQHIRALAGAFADRVEIPGPCDHAQIPRELADAAIVALPSEWEAAGYTCLEAMSAARGVIGSSAGGMAEMIEHGETGMLIPPMRPHAIAAAILAMLDEPDARLALGRAARDSVLRNFGPDRIGPLHEQAYARAISHAKYSSNGSRTT